MAQLAIKEKSQTTLRLRSDLMQTLKQQAKSENISLSLFLENVLTAMFDPKPNKITLEAIREVQSGKELEELDLDHFQEYVASL